MQSESRVYQVKKEIEDKVNKAQRFNCHVMKTDNHIAVYVFCNEKELEEVKPSIDVVLSEYRRRFSVYVLTENSWSNR